MSVIHKELNIAVIGYGYMGKVHTLCYKNLPFYYNLPDTKLNLYAVMDVRREIQKEAGFTKFFNDYEKLLADPKVDVVDICTPNFMHKPILMKAIKANKAIYCEKPLALNLNEAEEIIEVLNKSNSSLIHRIVFEYRFLPAVMKAKELIFGGFIGKIINFNFRYYGSEYIHKNHNLEKWQTNKEKAGAGVLYAMGSHVIDLIHYLIGEIVEVNAWAKIYNNFSDIKYRKETIEIEDIINAQIKVNNGSIGVLMISQVAAGSGIDLQFEIYGEKGSLKFDHSNPNVLKYFKIDEEFSGFKEIETMQKYPSPAVFPPPRVNISWIRYHIASQFNLINAVLNNEQARPNLIDGYKVQKVMSKILQSSVEQKNVIV